MAYIDAYFSLEKSDKTVPWSTKDEGVAIIISTEACHLSDSIDLK